MLKVKNIPYSKVSMEWQESLPKEKRESLEKIVRETENFESSYMDADNPPIGQIWTAMATMQERVEKLEQLVRAQRKALKELDVEVEVDKHIDEDLKNSLKRY
jgi:methionine synthase II (cobalamin-independent)